MRIDSSGNVGASLLLVGDIYTNCSNHAYRDADRRRADCLPEWTWRQQDAK